MRKIGIIGSLLFGILSSFIPGNCWAEDSLCLVTSMVGPVESHFGAAVAGIGDFNQDGYDDVAVAAPNEGDTTSLGDAAGVVRVFFGGPRMDTVPDLFAYSPYFYFDDAGFGSCVVGGGDLNGDGISDMAVSAPSSYVGTDVVGHVYVYHGARNFRTGDTIVYDSYLTGSFMYGGYGDVVAMGDLNADSCDDLAINGSLFNWEYAEIEIEFGPTNGFPDFTISKEILDFGDLSVGDLTGDGYDDLMVCTRYDIKEIYIFFGGDSLDTLQDMTLRGYGLWASVSYAGDLNGDGFGDMIVQDTTALIFLGGDPMDTVPGFTFPGRGRGTPIGDVNNDGNPDMAVAYWDPDSTLLVNLHFGGADFSTIPDVSVHLPGRHQGIAAAGDLNGDGYGEIIMSDSRNDEAGRDAGKVWIYTLRPWAVEESLGPRTPSIDLRISPNPISHLARIRYLLPGKAKVSLTIHDLSGRIVKTLVNEEREAGKHSATLNTEGLRAGVYFARFATDNYHKETKKLILLRQ